MTPDQKAAHITDLHAHYCAKSGFDMILNDCRRRLWWDWCGFSSWTWTRDDLGRVISYLVSQIKIDKRNDGALKFTNLIGQPDKFEEDLALAKKAAKPNAMFAAKPSPTRQAGGTRTNSQGEEIYSGKEAAAAFGNLFKKH